MYARIPTFKVNPGRMDEVIHYFKETTVPRLQKFQGFEGAEMLVNRQTGLFRVVAHWDSRESLEGSSEGVKPLRADVVREFGGEIVSVEEFEVAVKVPAAAMMH
jgi:quinol monooxygenase YgiN